MEAMPPRSVEVLDSRAALDAFLAASARAPILLFKHSRTCGRSAEAFAEIERYMARTADGPRVGMIVVQSHRDLSTGVSQRFALRHETPQVLLVRGGEVVWHASHGRVRDDTIAAAVETALARPA